MLPLFLVALCVVAVVSVAMLATWYSVAPAQELAISGPAAGAEAVNALSTWSHPGAPPIRGWVVTSAQLEPDGRRVTDSGGHVISTTSGTFCFLRPACGGGPVWEVELTAPGDASWPHYSATVVIDATTGKVRSMSSLGSK